VDAESDFGRIIRRSASEQVVNGKKAEIELAHPNMLPRLVRVTVKYHAKE